jgi:Rad/Gem-related GTP binding protein 1
MYSVVDERSFEIAEQMLLFLWKGEYIHTKGVILVGNKSDLERTRKIQTNGKQTKHFCFFFFLIHYLFEN